MEINEDIQTGSITHISLEDMRRVAKLRGTGEMDLFMELYQKKYVLDLIATDLTKVMDLFTEYPEFNNVTGKEKTANNKGTKDGENTQSPL